MAQSCTNSRRRCTAALLAVGLFCFISPGLAAGATHRIACNENGPYEFVKRLITAVPGDVLLLEEGTYEFDTELNTACDNVTIRGAGREATILSFKKQEFGTSGIVATGNNFHIADLTIQDTIGNAIKTIGCAGVTFRSVRARWTRGPHTENGAYGIYPVQCNNVLVEDCVAEAASDAGIYVGQSEDVIVRNCLATKNVAGIEIENTLRADVYDNEARDNTGGILVFDLPGLKLTNGGQIRVFKNRVRENNHKNFAPKGSIVGTVPSGTGIMIMAVDQVEVFDNEITDNQTTNIAIVSFHITERKIKDKKYDAYPEAISILNNKMSNAGAKPQGRIGGLLGPVIGVPFPDIFYDGILDRKKLEQDKLPADLELIIKGNGEIRFVNADLENFSLQNVFTRKYKPGRDLAPYAGERTRLAASSLDTTIQTRPHTFEAAKVYRAAPDRLSEWDLFSGELSALDPQDGVVPYELNQELFSDLTSKQRLIRIPAQSTITYRAQQVFDFPVGTVIAKTFSTPDRERHLETRIQVLKESGWFGFSYIWHDDQHDATLSLGGGHAVRSWVAASKVDGGKYHIPSAAQCLVCHSQEGKFTPLGPTARNLNRPITVDGESKNQLSHWQSLGILKEAAAKPPRLAAFDAEESAISTELLAKSWLDVSCAHCHQPTGSAGSSGLDLRFAQLDPERFGVWKTPVAAGRANAGLQYDIVPGKPDESILLHRIHSVEPGIRMPTLGRSLIDERGYEAVRRWIAEMKHDQKAKD